MTLATVEKRCVFFLGGYEPISPERQHERFSREIQRFERTWNVATSVSVMALSKDSAVASWRIETRAPNWRVETEYRSLRWDDVVAADFARSDVVRLPRALFAFADFIFSGTALRYFAVNWRYGLFFLYPIVILAAFAAAAIYGSLALANLDLPAPVLLGPAAALAIFAALIVWPGRPMLLPYMLDDWLFAYELVHKTRPELEQRLDSFAQDLAARLRDQSFDEIIVSAHSLGNALKLEVVDRALRLVPDFGRAGEKLSLLSTGSSLLKIALHPAGGWLKAAVERVSRHPAIFWIEYHALVDLISFYKVNPVTALKLPATGKPLLRKLRVRHMLEDETYRRFRGNFFRLHRQLVMGNDRRYFYDYFMICCGPFRLETRAEDPELMMTAIAQDGSLQLPESLSAGKDTASTETRP
jgi:hypothetical protein